LQAHLLPFLLRQTDSFEEVDSYCLVLVEISFRSVIPPEPFTRFFRSFTQGDFHIATDARQKLPFKLGPNCPELMLRPKDSHNSGRESSNFLRRACIKAIDGLRPPELARLR
jgi:hypothetical protein